MLATAAAALALGSPSGFLLAHRGADGGFAEPGSPSTPGLTAWAVIALVAGGGSVPAGSAEYLVANEDHLTSPTDVELGLVAEVLAHAPAAGLRARLEALERPGGSIGSTLNSTIWGVLALRQAGMQVPVATRAYLLARQARSGGWSWSAGVGADSNDTAAAVQALRALGVRGRPIQRGLVYLRHLQNDDGGFELSEGRGSDAQSTAWAIQAFVAAGVPPGAAAFRYLARLRRDDGSYRYSARYAVTPVWVTAQVATALARKPFPVPSGSGKPGQTP